MPRRSSSGVVGKEFQSFSTLEFDWDKQLQSQTALNPRKELQCPLTRKLGGPLSQCAYAAEEKNLLYPPEMKLWSLGYPVRSLATILTELFRLILLQNMKLADNPHI